MSLIGVESLRIERYSFFVKTFIVWALISVPWNISSLMVLNLTKSSNGTQVNYTGPNYTCYESIEDSKSWVEDIQFWMRGIIPAIISIFGIIFNIISVIVLKKCIGNEIFKKLLISLGMKQKNLPYARHFKPRLVFFFTHFSLRLRLILKTIYALNKEMWA